MNTVVIQNGSIVNINVYEGYSYDGNANGNRVIVDNSTVNNVVRGDYTLNNIQDNRTDYADSNAVSILKGSIIDGEISGGHVYKDKQATGNVVNLAGSTAKQTLYGGYIKPDSLARGNVVVIDNDADLQNTVYGGYVGNNGSAIGNVVDLAGATLSGDVYGGHAGTGDVATSNTVNISGNNGSAACPFSPAFHVPQGPLFPDFPREGAPDPVMATVCAVQAFLSFPHHHG